MAWSYGVGQALTAEAGSIERHNIRLTVAELLSMNALCPLDASVEVAKAWRVLEYALGVSGIRVRMGAA